MSTALKTSFFSDTIIGQTVDDVISTYGIPDYEFIKNGQLVYRYGSSEALGNYVFFENNQAVVIKERPTTSVNLAEVKSNLGQPEQVLEKYPGQIINPSEQVYIITWPSQGVAVETTGTSESNPVTFLVFYTPTDQTQFLHLIRYDQTIAAATTSSQTLANVALAQDDVQSQSVLTSPLFVTAVLGITILVIATLWWWKRKLHSPESNTPQPVAPKPPTPRPASSMAPKPLPNWNSGATRPAATPTPMPNPTSPQPIAPSPLSPVMTAPSPQPTSASAAPSKWQ